MRDYEVPGALSHLLNHAIFTKPTEIGIFISIERGVIKHQPFLLRELAHISNAVNAVRKRKTYMSHGTILPVTNNKSEPGLLISVFQHEKSVLSAFYDYNSKDVAMCDREVDVLDNLPNRA